MYVSVTPVLSSRACHRDVHPPLTIRPTTRNPTQHTGANANANGLAAPLLAEEEEEKAESGHGQGARPPQGQQHAPLPEPEAGLFSLWSFSWLNPVLSLGYRRPLTHDDLYELHPDETADVICAK